MILQRLLQTTFVIRMKVNINVTQIFLRQLVRFQYLIVLTIPAKKRRQIGREAALHL